MMTHSNSMPVYGAFHNIIATTTTCLVALQTSYIWTMQHRTIIVANAGVHVKPKLLAEQHLTWQLCRHPIWTHAALPRLWSLQPGGNGPHSAASQCLSFKSQLALTSPVHHIHAAFACLSRPASSDSSAAQGTWQLMLGSKPYW